MPPRWCAVYTGKVAAGVLIQRPKNESNSSVKMIVGGMECGNCCLRGGKTGKGIVSIQSRRASRKRNKLGKSNRQKPKEDSLHQEKEKKDSIPNRRKTLAFLSRQTRETRTPRPPKDSIGFFHSRSTVVACIPQLEQVPHVPQTRESDAAATRSLEISSYVPQQSRGLYSAV